MTAAATTVQLLFILLLLSQATKTAAAASAFGVQLPFSPLNSIFVYPRKKFSIEDEIISKRRLRYRERRIKLCQKLQKSLCQNYSEKYTLPIKCLGT
jgi:hypothetical protein